MPTQRKILLTAALLYACAVFYFMFFAFGRVDDAANGDRYTFIFAPGNFFKLPDPADLLHPSLMDLVSLGNIAAFIPAGLLVPRLRPLSFARFLIGFLLSILVLETVQALTFLGSFDMYDVLKNTLGAAIGFGAHKMGSRAPTAWRRLFVTGASIAAMLIVVWGIGSGIDQASTQHPGPPTALNEWQDSDGQASAGKPPYAFEIGGRTITPQFRVYDAGDEEVRTYRYKLTGQELWFALQYGIPDESEFRGRISLSVDGHEIFYSSDQDQPHEPSSFKWYFDEAHELTLTIEGRQKAWDITYREMRYFWE